jgi:hypothetical protein
MAPKDRKHKKSSQPKQQNDDSVTGVNPCRSHGFGIWGNRRVVMGVRVDEELKKQFISVSKRVFGSVCNPVESFMATVVACAKDGVNFGQTIDIGKIIIERNLRSRRKLEIREKTEVAETVEMSKCGFCGKPLVITCFKHLKSGVVKRACGYHAKVLRSRSDWVEVVSDE